MRHARSAVRCAVGASGARGLTPADQVNMGANRRFVLTPLMRATSLLLPRHEVHLTVVPGAESAGDYPESVMARVPIYELAKELGVESGVIMAKLTEMGEFVRSASSTVEAPLVRKLKAALAHGEAALDPEQQAGHGHRGDAFRSGRVTVHSGAGSAPAAPDPGSRPVVHVPGAAYGPGDDLAPALIRELLEDWDLLVRLAPEPGLAVSFLAGQSKLPPKDIDRVRRVRNRCAHPGDQGWPGPYDLDLALATARELRRRLVPPTRSAPS